MWVTGHTVISSDFTLSTSLSVNFFSSLQICYLVFSIEISIILVSRRLLSVSYLLWRWAASWQSSSIRYSGNLSTSLVWMREYMDLLRTTPKFEVFQCISSWLWAAFLLQLHFWRFTEPLVKFCFYFWFITFPKQLQ